MAIHSAKTTTTSKAKKARSYELSEIFWRAALGLLFVGIGISPISDTSTRVFLVAMFALLVVSGFIKEMQIEDEKWLEERKEKNRNENNSIALDKIIQSQELSGQALATILQFIHNAQAAGQQRRE